MEVLLAKPSKPEKWDLPSDISLRAALQRDKAQRQSELDGTMALNGTAGSTKRTRAVTQPPRHEQFASCGTSISFSAALHRRIKDDPYQLVAGSPTKPLHSTNMLNKYNNFHDTEPTSYTPLTSLKFLATTGSASALQVFSMTPAEVAAQKIQLSEEELAKQLVVTPFTRMVLLFKYNHDDMLWALNDAVEKVNQRALPDIQGTIRSYSLTDQEMENSIKGTLDVISGDYIYIFNYSFNDL